MKPTTTFCLPLLLAALACAHASPAQTAPAAPAAEPAAATAADEPASDASTSPVCYAGRGGLMIPRGHMVAQRDVLVRVTPPNKGEPARIEALAGDSPFFVATFNDQTGYLVADVVSRDRRFGGVAHMNATSWTFGARAQDGSTFQQTGFVNGTSLTLITFDGRHKLVDTLEQVVGARCEASFAAAESD